MIKNILVFARKSIKLTILLGVSIFLIICAVTLFFKPIYSVSLNGEQIGYSKDKGKLQSKINSYMEKGDGTENVAFVQIDAQPEYKLCLLKRNIVTNDDEIYEEIISQGIPYYKFYAISVGEEEKAYVKDFATAEEIVNTLKEKESTNVEEITIHEMYETELAELSDAESVVEDLYVEKVVVAEVKPKTTSTGSVNTSTNMSYQKVALGINLIKPITGTITSRFGAKSSRRVSDHTGLDIAAPKGTPIKAAAAGTVTFSGEKGSYGLLIVITHDNGIQTYYGHCSKLYVSAGTRVSQGQTIAAVGSTGNSSGPHLHLEIRINGIAYNPQNYLY